MGEVAGTSWRTRHTVVVVDFAGAPRVMVMPRAGGWTVPQWEVEEAEWLTPVADPARQMKDIYSE